MELTRRCNDANHCEVQYELYNMEPSMDAGTGFGSGAPCPLKARLPY